jgi:transposase InsO family protein
MCEVLDVTRQGYNKWLKSQGKPYKHEALLALIKQVLKEDDENAENYGVKRIFLALRNNKGYTGSYSTVCRVCRENGITLPKKKNPNSLTKADKEAQKSEDLIKQDFTADRPNEKWLSDITEVPCADGKLYVAPVLDCFDGAIVGLVMDDNMRKELCINAFEQACRRQNASGMIFHSDRGSQYTSGDFRASLARYGAIQSMCGTGRCYDNARMESFFATLKKEKLYRIKTEQLPMETVKSIIWRYIESYYNNRRIYTTNDGYPPLVYRSMYYQDIRTAA